MTDAKDGMVIALTSAWVEYDFLWIGSDKFCQGWARLFKGGLGLAAKIMGAWGIAELFKKIRLHGLWDLRVYGRGWGVIKVNIFHLEAIPFNNFMIILLGCNLIVN